MASLKIDKTHMKMADSPLQILSPADYEDNGITQIMSWGTDHRAKTKAVPVLQPVNDI